MLLRRILDDNETGSALVVVLGLVGFLSLAVAVRHAANLQGGQLSRRVLAQGESGIFPRAVEPILELACRDAVDPFHSLIFNPELSLPAVYAGGAPNLWPGRSWNHLSVVSIGFRKLNPLILPDTSDLPPDRPTRLFGPIQGVDSDWGIQSSGLRCFTTHLVIETRLPSGMPGRGVQIPMTVLVDPITHQLASCQTGPSTCTTRVPIPEEEAEPLEKPDSPSKPRETGRPCEAPMFGKLRALPLPIPVGQGVTLDWSVDCAFQLFLSVDGGAFKEISPVPPINLPAPPEAGSSYQLKATLGERYTLASLGVSPGKACQLAGLQCDVEHPCCQGECRSDTRTCGDPCTQQGRFLLQQASCTTTDLSDVRDHCGLTEQPGGTWRRGEILPENMGDDPGPRRYRQTWFQCQDTPEERHLDRD